MINCDVNLPMSSSLSPLALMTHGSLELEESYTRVNNKFRVKHAAAYNVIWFTMMAFRWQYMRSVAIFLRIYFL